MNKIRRLFAPMDMTVGSPWKKILLFMIPIFGLLDGGIVEIRTISSGKGRVPVYVAIGSMAIWDGVCRLVI